MFVRYIDIWLYQLLVHTRGRATDHLWERRCTAFRYWYCYCSVAKRTLAGKKHKVASRQSLSHGIRACPKAMYDLVQVLRTHNCSSKHLTNVICASLRRSKTYTSNSRSRKGKRWWDVRRRSFTEPPLFASWLWRCFSSILRTKVSKERLPQKKPSAACSNLSI